MSSVSAVLLLRENTNVSRLLEDEVEQAVRVEIPRDNPFLSIENSRQLYDLLVLEGAVSIPQEQFEDRGAKVIYETARSVFPSELKSPAENEKP